MGDHQRKDANGQEEDNSYSPALSNSALERLQLHMQLQNLQKPFSFYNNPALWPKLLPLQEKLMIQSLQSLNQSQLQNVEFYEPPTAAISMPKVNELENNSSMAFNPVLDSALVPSFQAELDDFLNDKNVAFEPQEDQIAEFDCFKEMNGSKDSVVWWSNDFETKSGSSNSWDSTSHLHESDQQMFQDYELGYINM